MVPSKQGKLIVIEGGDGSGKGTQSKLLAEYFQKNSIPFEYVDFPNYDSFYGAMVAQYLRGEFGPIEHVSPYLASLLYALDRQQIQTQIKQYLDEGKMVLANRYVTSNMAHQGSKFTDSNERDTFISWLRKLEYTKHGMPQEDVVIYLHVPWQVAMELTKKKDDRPYLQGKKEDIHEADQDYREKTEQMYHLLASTNQQWIILECVENGTIKSKEQIHTAIVNLLQNKAII